MPASTGYEVIRQQLSDMDPTRVDAAEGNFVISTVISNHGSDTLVQTSNDHVVRTYFYDGSGRITGVEFGTNSSSSLDAVVVCVGG